jgi:hypothetical protein
MRGIKTKVTMERTLYVDLPDGATEAEVLEAANKEIILPTNALYTASQALKNLHINIPNLDLKDWDTTDIKYEIIQ